MSTGKIVRDCSTILQRSGRLQETLTTILCSSPATLSTKDLWEIGHESAALSVALQTAERTASGCGEPPVETPLNTSPDVVVEQILLAFHKAHWSGCVRSHRYATISLLRALVEHLLPEVDPTWPALRPWCTLVGVHNALIEQIGSAASADAPPSTSSVSGQQRPPKRLSLTALLQMLAQKRADRCCEVLIEWLLEDDSEALGTERALSGRAEWSRSGRRPSHAHGVGLSEHLGDADVAVAPHCDDDNSSIEVLRTLADHMSPGGRARAAAVAAGAATNTSSAPSPYLERLLRDDAELLNALLTALAACAPAVLGMGGARKGKPRAGARRKAWRFYQRAAWAAAGTRLDHSLLWWRDTAVTVPGRQANKLRERALRYGKLCESSVPLCAAALGGLGDALAAYIGIVSWDRRFRTPLVRSWPLRTSDDTEKHGRRWKNLFTDLVRMCRACEPGPNLEEAPVVEQIPLLHRLDHSLHAFRIWTSARARALAARWDIDALFRSAHADVRECIQVVDSLKLQSHKDVVSFDSVHVAVCIKMRAKLVSEVADNLSKLKGVPEETVGALAAACRTLTLASLGLTFPDAHYWRRRQGSIESGAPYVRSLLEQILLPVLRASPLLPPASRGTVCALVLKVMCDTWLHHIYSNRIRFSEIGAAQLLEDFSGVAAFLQSLKNSLLKDEQVSRALLRHEVLRRCEGVARLLLRRPGERIAMSQGDQPATATPPTDNSLGCMPAEMYVPNQEQWLKLRASSKNTFCCASIRDYM